MTRREPRASGDGTSGAWARRAPEVLAPAGDAASLAAALLAGADSVYFGLSSGFNARARAANFTLEGLAATAARIRRAGARSYLTLNTLVFEPELAPLERVVRAAAAAGVDALIVQDPAVALIARAVCPGLEVHASTQMTISSAEGAEVARALGASRVVLPRELSVDEVRRFAEATDIETEVFIHGALCVSWSGQCLTSEAWGGRSANRGQCAQSCRMPYALLVDGDERALAAGAASADEAIAYLLSPKDLAGFRAVAALGEIGVHGLKIEGRQKGPHYVATAVAGYRRFVDALAARDGIAAPEAVARMQDDLRDMALAYTRGFGDGFLAGSDHQTLVEGRFPKHRGICLGRVARVDGETVHVEPVAIAEARPWTGGRALHGEPSASAGPVGRVRSPLGGATGGADEAASGPEPAPLEPRAGMGVVFDAGRPETEEVGGPIFHVAGSPESGWTLRFGRPGPDLDRVVPGQRVWITSDPQAVAATERALRADAEPTGRVALHLTVAGAAGEPLRASARIASGACEGHEVTRSSSAPLERARGRGLDEALLRDKLGALGGTPFRLAALDAGALPPDLFVAPGALKGLRREIVSALGAALDRGPARALAPEGALDRVRAEVGSADIGELAAEAPLLVPLCRSEAQLEAAIESGLREVELDLMDFVGLGRAVERARAAGLRVVLVTVRVQKPGEEPFDARLARLDPDAVLVRHWGALVHFARRAAAARERGLAVHGDFSLNVTNSITARWLLGAWGLATVTASHDLDDAQLFALLEGVPAGRVAVVLHHRMATFHTEHCVYAHLLSSGRDFHTCGRPCERHEVSLRDHKGHEHPVIVDVGCRNTVFNADAQSGAALVPELLRRGVRRFRIELVRESRAETRALLRAYGGLLAGETTPAALLRDLGVRSQHGVGAGPMALLV